MRGVGVLILLTLATAPAAADTFGGHECTIDCSGHAAGYEWARRRQVVDRRDCFDSPVRSFQEGCTTWLDRADRRPWVDDDGRPIRRRH